MHLTPHALVDVGHAVLGHQDGRPAGRQSLIEQRTQMIVIGIEDLAAPRARPASALKPMLPGISIDFARCAVSMSPPSDRDCSRSPGANNFAPPAAHRAPPRRAAPRRGCRCPRRCGAAVPRLAGPRSPRRRGMRATGMIDDDDEIRTPAAALRRRRRLVGVEQRAAGIAPQRRGRSRISIDFGITTTDLRFHPDSRGPDLRAFEQQVGRQQLRTQPVGGRGACLEQHQRLAQAVGQRLPASRASISRRWRMPSSPACTSIASARYGLAVASATRNSTLNWRARWPGSLPLTGQMRSAAPRSSGATSACTGAQRLGRRR